MDNNLLVESKLKIIHSSELNSLLKETHLNGNKLFILIEMPKLLNFHKYRLLYYNLVIIQLLCLK